MSARLMLPRRGPASPSLSRRIVRRVIVYALILGAGFLTAMIAVVLVDTSGGAGAPAVANRSYPGSDGEEIYSYVAEAPAADAPVVFMFHEWWGLNRRIAELANMLSMDGYTVIVPDLYRGRSATTVPGALALRLTADMQRITADVNAVARGFFAESTPENSAKPLVGLLGFCFGGDVAMEFALTRPEFPAATILLYGGTDQDTERLAALSGRTPLLGIFGAQDSRISVDQVQQFERALAQAQVGHRITIYPGVGHAFVQPDTILENGAAADAWNQIREFFDLHLKSLPTGRRIGISPHETPQN